MLLCTSIHTMCILIESDWFRERAEFSHQKSQKSVLSLSGNLSNDLCYYANRNLSVKPLSSTWITSVFITICSLEIVQFVANLAMITAVRVFRMPFVLF